MPTVATRARSSGPVTAMVRRLPSVSSRASISPGRRRTATGSPTYRCSRPSATRSPSTPTARCAASPPRGDGRCSTSGAARSGPPSAPLVDEFTTRIAALGFAATDARTLAEHFADCERRGKRGHGRTRVDWLETLTGYDAGARPERVVAEPGYERWDSGGALGYLTLAAVCDAQLAEPPEHARLIVAVNTFPTGALGYWARRLAEGGLVAVLTATSPRRLPHPEGRPPLTGTTPLASPVPRPDRPPP